MSINSLKVRNESIFSKIFHFFAGLFHKNEPECAMDQSTPGGTNETKIPNTTPFSGDSQNSSGENRIVELQKIYEQNPSYIHFMADEDVHALNQLYREQVQELKETFDKLTAAQ